MARRKFSIEPDTWEKMRAIKDQLNCEEGEIIPWDEAFQYILEYFQEGGGCEDLDINPIFEKKNTLKKPKMPPIKIEAPKLPKNSPKKKNDKKSKNIATDDELGIPKVPMKDPIKMNAGQDLIDLVKSKETKNTKYILIECDICGEKPIAMPVPKDIVENADVPVVDVSYVHGDPLHVIVAQLDHDYQVRRRRASKVVFEKDFENKK